MNKRNYAFIAMLALVIASITPVFAVKPDKNLAGAQEIPWNLSAEVMPVPPYGALDIPGSDEASKLIINQANGAVEVAITGVMKGLNPETSYRVFLSNGYTPYQDNGWDITGPWHLVCAGIYHHDYKITQDGTTFTGEGTGPGVYELISGTINPMTGEVLMHGKYYVDADHTTPVSNNYEFDAAFTIDPATGALDGELIINQAGLNFDSTSGTAVRDVEGNQGWTGLFNAATIPVFTFETDENGCGSWHVNLKNADFPSAGNYDLSVWINGNPGGTLLISDSFTVVVE